MESYYDTPRAQGFPKNTELNMKKDGPWWQHYDLESLRFFCTFTSVGSHLIVEDKHQTDKYMHNFFWIGDSSIDQEALLNYYQQRKKKKYMTLRLEDQAEAQKNVLPLPLPTTITKYFYMTCSLANWKVPLPPAITIEDVAPGDVENLAFLAEEDRPFGEAYAHHNGRRIHAIMKEYPHYQMVQARIDGQIVGHVLWITFGDVAEFDEFYVSPRFQHRGIGTALLYHVKQQAIQSGIQSIFLTTNAADTAYLFYEKMGFKVQGYYHDLRWLFTK